MAISLDSFKSQTMGKTYGNPPPTLEVKRGTYQGQCVSYVRQWLSAGLNTNWGAVGNAVDYANKANQARFKTLGFTWKTDKSFKDGDILVWGNDKGNWTGPAGHIAIWYKDKILNQNYGGSLKVSLNTFFEPGYLGRYTKNAPKPVPKPSVKGKSTLNQGEKLTGDQSLWSENGKYEARFQKDSNFVLYKWSGKSKKVLWASDTWKKGGTFLTMQKDGNLVIYKSWHRPIWASNTFRKGGVRLTMQNDGNLVMYTAKGKPVWATNTNGK